MRRQIIFSLLNVVIAWFVLNYYLYILQTMLVFGSSRKANDDDDEQTRKPFWLVMMIRKRMESFETLMNTHMYKPTTGDGVCGIGYSIYNNFSCITEWALLKDLTLNMTISSFHTFWRKKTFIICYRLLYILTAICSLTLFIHGVRAGVKKAYF